VGVMARLMELSSRLRRLMAIRMKELRARLGSPRAHRSRRSLLGIDSML